MKLFSAWLIGPLTVATLAVAAVPAAAQQSRTAVVPDAVAGSYTVFTNWNGGGYQSFSMTLNRNHTGTTPMNDTITWSINVRAFSMTMDGVNFYKGTTTKAGFNSKRHPGTVTSNNGGGTGIWYAIKTG
jgi:hypothetical protein